MTIEHHRETIILDGKHTLIINATTDTTSEPGKISVRHSARYYLKTRWRTREITEQEMYALAARFGYTEDDD